MTKLSSRSFLHYFTLATLALSIISYTALRVNVKPAHACSGTLVLVGDQVVCHVSGSNPGGGDGGDGNDGGGGDDGDSNSDNNSNNDTNEGEGCAYGEGGTVEANVILSYDPSTSMCEILPAIVDACTGEMVEPNGDQSETVPCTANNPPAPPNPCDEFVVSGGGVTCTTDFTEGSSFPGSQWQLTVRAPWPGAEIHTRPYPVTLVDYDTVMRVMSLGSSSSSGHLGYAAWGGGNPGSPAAGDWSDITLRLEIKPIANWADVFLENIGLIRMRVGELHTFQWHLPSHPAAGGGPLSGEVGQLEELEPDVPLFSNWTRAPYMVYCTITYYEWESACVGGPDPINGSTNCRRDGNGVFTGHKEWGWKRHSQTTPITPSAAGNAIPANLLADINGDGVFDGYWGRLSFIRRMDDAGSVTNPVWAHSYSWGAWWYWGVREAQGQIGWPGVDIDK